MRKTYDKNGDVILTADQMELCRLAEYLHDVVDQLFILEDQIDLDLAPVVGSYRDLKDRLEMYMKVAMEEDKEGSAKRGSGSL